MIYKTDEREKNGLASGGFDDSGFADPSCVEIDISTFFCGFFLHI